MSGRVAFAPLFTGGLTALVLLAGCPEELGFSSLASALVVRPERVQVERLWAGLSVGVPLVVENRGSAPFLSLSARVEDVSGPGELVVVPLGEALPAGSEVELRLTATAFGEGVGPLTGTLVVRADEAEVSVPLSALVVPRPDCDDGNPCTHDRFDPGSGACVRVALPDLAVCDDDNACTESDQCLQGVCTGRPLACADPVGCTVDRCDPSIGCVFEPIDQRCDDDDPCTDDLCDASRGCANEPKPTGSVCHHDGCAEIGFCVEGSCVVQPVPDDIPCEDGDPCTRGDTCQQGTCTAGEQTPLGAPAPAVVEPSYVGVSHCGGPEPFLGGCYGWVGDATVEEVLAARRAGSFAEVVWRSPFLDVSGVLCDPRDPMYQVEWLPPREGGNGADRGAQPIGPVCAAGVFVSRAPWSGGATSTTQLTVVRGPAAAAFEDPLDEGPGLGGLAVAHAGLDGRSVWLERRRADGSIVTEPRLTAWPLSVLEDRVTELAVGLTPGRAVVVGHGYLRDFDTLADCAFPGCLTGVPLGMATFYEGPSVSPVDVEQVFLEEVFDESCGEPWVAPRLLEVRDLEVHARRDGVNTVALRMRPSACGDAPGNEHLALAPYVARVGASVGGAPVAPLVALAGDGVVRALAADAAGDLAAVREVTFPCDCACAAGEECACLDAPAEPCTRWELAFAPVGGNLDALLGDLVSDEAFARPLRVEGAPRLAARIGGRVLLAWRGEQGLERLDPPALEGFSWAPGRLLGGPAGVVAGRGQHVASGSAEGEAACPPEECGAPLPPPGVPVLVQRFGCGFEAPPPGPEEACLGDIDCGEGSFCQREGVCLPPPGCEEGCEPVCYGACVALPRDAGVPDAGSSDAGLPDAGSSNAGSRDAGTDAGPNDAGW